MDPSLNPSQNSVLDYGYVNSLAYGSLIINGTPTPEFVALVNITADHALVFGAGSVIMSSSDGTTWTEDAQFGVFTILNCVAYGNGEFVAGAIAGTVYWSTDLKNWTPGSGLPTSFNYTVNAVAYGNGMFVAVGVTNYTAGAIFSSPDGANWSLVKLPTTPTPAPFSSVTFANGFFVATTGSEYGSSGNIWVSPDGANWVQTSVTASGSLNAVAYGDYQYIAVGNGGAILGSVLAVFPTGPGTTGFNPPPSGSPPGTPPCFWFDVMGPPGPPYGVYVSTDLINWTWLQNVNFNSSPIQQVTDCGGSAQAYYYLGPPGP